MRKLRDIPIRRKLIIVNTLISSVALLLACIAFVGYEVVAFRVSMISDLSATAAMIGGNSAAALAFDDPSAAIQTLRSVSVHPHMVGAALYDRDGKLFARYQRPGGTVPFVPPAVERDGHRFGTDSLELFRSFAVAGEQAGTVYLLSDLSELRTSIWQHVAIVVAVLLAACVIAFVLSTFLQSTIATPISHLASVVTKVRTRQDYSLRADWEGTDELGELIDGFNAMLAQIQAQDRALQEAHDHLEARVRERTLALQDEIARKELAQAQLDETHNRLVEASRQAGRAEIATNVLHNVGNVLNSVNVSAGVVTDNVRNSKIDGLPHVLELMQAHANDLGAYLTQDARGRHLPIYLVRLSEYLQVERATNIKELDSLRANIDHIKHIVSMQQSNAKASGVWERVNVEDLVEDALRMNRDALESCAIRVIRDFEHLAPIATDRHKVLQILVNLIRNAKHACNDSQRPDKEVTLRIRGQRGRVRIAIVDNGVGIAAENLQRIFGHGFTTRKDGHGFGLHSSALAAHDLGGCLHAASNGLDQGASFTLELPLESEVEAA